MSLNPQSEFPGKINAADANYPYGSAKNVSVAGDNTGTPFTARLLNDFWGFFQKLLTVAGNTPSGNPDTVVASDYYNALVEVIQTEAPLYSLPQATETVRGGAEIATSAEASAGTSDTVMLTPLKMANGMAGNAQLTANGYQKLPGGLILQWGTTSALVSEQIVFVDLPIVFPTAFLNLQVSCNRATTEDNTDLVNAYGSVVNLSQLRIVMDNVADGNVGTPVMWFAIGY